MRLVPRGSGPVSDLKAQTHRGRHIVGEHPVNVTRLGSRCTAPDHPDHYQVRAVCRVLVERLVICSRWDQSSRSRHERADRLATGDRYQKRTPHPLLRSHVINSRHRLHEIAPCLCRRRKQFMVPPDQIVAPGIVHRSDTPTPM